MCVCVVALGGLGVSIKKYMYFFVDIEIARFDEAPRRTFVFVLIASGDQVGTN